MSERFPVNVWMADDAGIAVALHLTSIHFGSDTFVR